MSGHRVVLCVSIHIPKTIWKCWCWAGLMWQYWLSHFSSRSQVWIDCVISYQRSSYRRSHWAWHPSSSIWSPQFPASGSSSPCVLFSFRMSHFSPPPGSPHLESLASPSSLSITCQSCLTSLYLPFPGPFMTLNDFPAPSPDFLLWSRWRTAWTDTLVPLFFPTVV